jgi:hypothetical protein
LLFNFYALIADREKNERAEDRPVANWIKVRARHGLISIYRLAAVLRLAAAGKYAVHGIRQ